MVEIHGEGIVTVGSASVSMRSYLSTQHLWMAQHSARYARAYEDKYAGQRDAFHIHLRGYVLASVTESVAFVEALVNELFTDVHDSHADERINVFAPEARSRMRDYWRVVNFGKTVDILAKYEMVRLLNNTSPSDTSVEPYQSMRLLIALRNWQLHYYPSNVSDSEPHNLQAKLERKFEPNALMASSGNAWFPDKALGAGCAEWSVGSATAFADDFVTLFNYEPNYRKIAHPVDPPDLAGTE